MDTGYGNRLVLKVLEEATIASKRNLKYVLGILNNWMSKGGRTIREAEEASRNFKARKKLHGHKEVSMAARLYRKKLAQED